MLLYAIGSSLMTPEEVREGDVAARLRTFARQGATGILELPTGVVMGTASASNWTPIGVGKPLTVDIRQIYTGHHPDSSFWTDEKDMLVTTAIKSIATYDAKPRAINFLKKAVKAHSRLTRPGASEEGTPVIHYSPAAVERSLTLDIEIVFDRFPQPVFEALKTAFTAAAGVPVFLSYSTYLLAAGEIAKIAGSAGEAWFDGKPALNVSSAIDLDLPGTIPTQAGFLLVVPDDLDRIDPTFRTRYQVVDGKVVDSAGREYDGTTPYVVLGVDGSERADLASFAPTAASAAVLSRFLGVHDGQQTPLAPLMDALKLYNDYSYRLELDKLDKRIAALSAGEEKTTLQAKRTALLKNITSDLMKPSPPAAAAPMSALAAASASSTQPVAISAMSHNSHYCRCFTLGDLPPADLQRLSQQRAAVLKSARWQSGDKISIRFLQGSPALQAKVEKVARQWTKIANLIFDFVDKGPTDVRIAFIPGQGSWSYLGTICRQIQEPLPTMNYGWLTDDSDDDEIQRVVLHEFGHTLGLIHEHQNPKGGIQWDRAAVTKDLSGPPNNWNDQTIENNMFHYYPKEDIVGTEVDADSIMMYPIPARWTGNTFSSGLNKSLSSFDVRLIQDVYP